MTHALFSPRRREHAAREAERQELLASLASTQIGRASCRERV